MNLFLSNLSRQILNWTKTLFNFNITRQYFLYTLTYQSKLLVEQKPFLIYCLFFKYIMIIRCANEFYTYV